MRARGLVVVAVTAVVGLLAGCGGSSGSGSESTTTGAPSPAKVTSFDVGDLMCGVATTAPVTVTWGTQDATAVEVGVDTFPAKGFGPSGSTEVVVPCDDQSHTITITPRSDAGVGEAESKDVSP